MPVEYILRRVPQEGLEGEPVDRIREAFDNTQVHICIIFAGKSNRQCEAAYKSFIVCTVVYETHKSCRQKLQTKVSSCVPGFISCIRVKSGKFGH